MMNHFDIFKFIVFFVILFVFVKVVVPLDAQERVSFTLGGESYSKEIPMDPSEKDKMIHDLATLISTYDETYGSTDQEVSNSLLNFSSELNKTKTSIDDLILTVQSWEPTDFNYEEIRKNIETLANTNKSKFDFGIGGSVIMNNSNSTTTYGPGLNAHVRYGDFYINALFGFISNMNNITSIGIGMILN